MADAAVLVGGFGKGWVDSCKVSGKGGHILRVDLRGEPGVVRNLKAVRKALEDAGRGRVVEILVDDPVTLERLADLFPDRLREHRAPKVGYVHLVLAEK